jgi:hypothetical protein
MELSQIERAVIETMISGDAEQAVLRNQLKVATVVKRNYTGVGVFVTFHVPSDALRMKMTNRYIQSTPMAFLKHPELSPGAQAMLWFKDACMSSLECVTVEGAWPSDESKFQIEPYGFPSVTPVDA